MIVGRVMRELRRRRDQPIVEQSGLWDAEWYLENNPDVAALGTDPLTHYLLYGAREGRSPGPHFDAHSYYVLNPSSRRHPLVHYMARPETDRQATPPGWMVEAGHPVLTSGWFDVDWYSRHRGHVLTSDVHPYVDYVHFGEAAGIPPSPVLDVGLLRDRLPVDDKSQCVLAGAIAHDLIATVRPTAVASVAPARGDVIVPRSGRARTAKGSVLAAVHAHYADVLPEILTSVANLPPESTIAVVVPDEDRIAETERLIDDLVGSKVKRVVIATENRGRNFGPLVSTLAPLVRRHDFLVHLHTKKSVYSGRVHDEWRRHVVTSLVGTRGLVETILGLFDDRPSLGVVYPSAFEGVPHWAHHWLANIGVGRELYARLGLDPSRVSGVVDYPVGGMFWARTSALLPLWDAGFTLEDFPAEPIPSDGTIAHAIERSILDIARGRAFDVVEVDLALPQWRLNWSARRPLPERAQLEDEIPRAVAEADLVTVDLFDTLVLRPSLSPATLQRLVAGRVAGTFALEPDDLLRHRIEAEDRARLLTAGDVGIDDIRGAADAQWRDAVAAQLDAEIALEADIAVPRRWLIDLLQSLKRSDQRMVLMSDTYLPSGCIEDLLDRIGASHLFDEIVVSNAVRARKDSGAMWDLVESRYGVPREKWVHLGDNEHSDVQIPRDRGIDARHVPSPHGAAVYHGIDRRGVDRDRVLGTDLVVGLAVAGLLGNGQSWWDEATPARRFGWSGVGPLLWTYVTWLIQHRATHEAQRILFVARDGYLPWTLFERLRPLVERELPKSEYFLTSRRSALAYAQANGLRTDLLIGTNTWKGTMRDLVRLRLGVDLDGDPRLEEHLELPADLERARSVLDAHASTIVDHGRRDLAAMTSYLESLGIEDSDNIVLADLGYSATIQCCLESVLPHSYTGLYAATTPQARRARGPVHALFDENVSWPAEPSVIMQQALLLELLWAPDHGQVDRIESTPEGPVARFRAPDGYTEAERAEVHEIQAAAIDFCLEVIERFGPGMLDQPIEPSLAVMPFDHLASGAHAWANDVLARAEVEGDFTGAGFSRVRRFSSSLL